MKIKKHLKDWFTLSSRERTGIMVLLILIVCILAVNFFLRYTPIQQKRYDYTSYNQELELFRNSLRHSGVDRENRPEEMDAGTVQFFPFDPNTVTKSEMMRLGMEERIARRIIAYREKGGRFRKKEDLLKIYGIDRMLYASLIPYINIPEPEVHIFNPYRQAEEFYCGHPVEINSSDTSALTELSGIGPVLATRIIKYRGLLGGYYSVEQLKEVYGISDSLFQAIRHHVTVDTVLVSRISINEANEAQLSRHPYIGRYHAKAILAYRKSSGSIRSTEELVRNKIIPEEQQARVRAYVSFQTPEE